jgi:hypothetical protein
MNRDDIIRIAREAGFNHEGWDWEEIVFPIVERFAALVAAAEREKVARWQIGSGYSTGHGETIEDLLVELEWQVRENEREECAKVCVEYYNNAQMPWQFRMGANECAYSIRERGAP